MSGPKLLRFGSKGILKILWKMMALFINQLIYYKGVCTTAPATPGLLKIYQKELLQ